MKEMMSKSRVAISFISFISLVKIVLGSVFWLSCFIHFCAEIRP
jgi:hypothetical protein